MTRRLNFLSALALAFLFGTMAFAQPNIYDDDVVKDPDGQHKEWKAGKTKYPSKPRDMWELGLHGGIFMITGDVNPWPGIPGYAFGASVRKSMGYLFSVRLTGHYGRTKGVNFQPNMAAAYQNRELRTVGDRGYGSQVVFTPNGIGGNSFDEVRRVGSGVPWFANYENKYIEAAVQGIITLNNLKFHKERNKWDLFVFGGIGGNLYSMSYDALSGGDIYDDEFNNLSTRIYPGGDLDRDTREGRKEIRQILINDILDGEFETPGEVWGNLWNIGGTSDKTDKANRVGKAIANVGVGVGYHLNKRITLSLEHQSTFTDDDLLDGYRWHDSGTTPGSDVDFTRDVDVPHYTNLRLNFHLGSFKKRVEPLWWLNPLDAPYQQIAVNTQKVSGDTLDDDDGDGVPNKLDREPNTPADCPVDTRGVTLDSDSDGVPDCQDKEPYSPPGYPVDPDGIAQIPPDNPGLTEADVIAIGNARWIDDVTYPPAPEVCSNEWFLPMVHYDLDKYYLKPEFYPQLHHIANTMLRCPGLQVVVTGHTDARLPNPYNDVLSYKRAEKSISYLVNNYGIDRSRLVLQYSGEANPIVSGLGDSHSGNRTKEQAQYMNRRVEFRVARGEAEMGRPAYDGNWDSVGKDTPGSSRGSTIYSGNPGAGY